MHRRYAYFELKTYFSTHWNVKLLSISTRTLWMMFSLSSFGGPNPSADLYRGGPYLLVDLDRVWLSFTVGDYLGEILAYGGGISQENKRFSHDSFPKATEWETWNPMQTNQSTLVGVYFSDRCGFRCHVVKLFLIHVMLGNVLFYSLATYDGRARTYEYISVLGILYDFLSLFVIFEI